MRAILINTQTKTISEITINDWRDIAPAIGNECTTFACPVTLPNGDDMYIDDEGLYHPYEGGIIMEDWYCPIVGNVVLLNHDEDGDSTDAVSTIDELYKQIKFVSKADCDLYNAIRY